MPVARFHLRSARATGGVAVETVPGDSQSIELRFFDASGADIDEGAQRAIERVYFREDARRAFPDEIGELRYPPRALEFYQTGLLDALDVEVIRGADLKSVVDCAFGPASLVLPAIIGKSTHSYTQAVVGLSRVIAESESPAPQLMVLIPVAVRSSMRSLPASPYRRLVPGPPTM